MKPVLLVIGILAALGFLWGVVKSALKAALFAALAGGAAWIWYFNIR